LYQLARGFIQRCSHGRFMIMGARDGADMFAVVDGGVRVVEVRRAGNGGVKIPEVRELVIHFRELELAATAGTGLALGGLVAARVYAPHLICSGLTCELAALAAQ
jgi:hypothetical protein